MCKLLRLCQVTALQRVIAEVKFSKCIFNATCCVHFEQNFAVLSKNIIYHLHYSLNIKFYYKMKY